MTISDRTTCGLSDERWFSMDSRGVTAVLLGFHAGEDGGDVIGPSSGGGAFSNRIQNG
ncbi:hypothetical protein Hanom_Chr01g00026921 [Helianthus anomalus]